MLNHVRGYIAAILQIGPCIEAFYRPALQLFMTACYEADEEFSPARY